MQIRLLEYESTTAAGRNLRELRDALDHHRSGLRRNDMQGCDIDTWIGRVSGLSAIDLGVWQSRNNALAALGLEQGNILRRTEQLKQQFSPARIGVVIGSSTASIDRTEQAYRHLDEQGRLSSSFRQANVHNPHAPALFVAHRTGITGPSMTINTACSSSAKVFATGARWLQSGVVDAVLVGGVDTLCMSVLYGFSSLQLVSSNPCKPFDQHRDGINLGEAAGFAILMRAEDCDKVAEQAEHHICLSGYGESSDAHHMSHPHPEGLGAKLSMQSALNMAKLPASAVDYLNLHGTASTVNDTIEGKVVAQTFPRTTQVSSTKGWMGHTLGAAGITEALIAADALQRNIVPGSLNLEQLDDELELSISAENIHRELNVTMSNSFGFGGNNCSLLFSKNVAPQ